MFAAGTLSNPYPLRRVTTTSSSVSEHSLRFSGAECRKLKKFYARYLREFLDGGLDLSQQTEPDRTAGLRGHRLPPERIAKEFARFAAALQDVHQQTLAPLHLESGYAMLCRRVEQIPRRMDRVVCAAMSSAMLATTGMRVHLVVDNESAISWLETWLLPIYEKMEIRPGVIHTGASELERATAYAQAVTLVSARECAMDFLRDAVKWPERSDPALAKLDRITGKRSKSQALLMRGLPCGVFLDIDSALIDGAVAPVALTRDAHPMHETEELQQALEMVTHLERGKHYVLTEEGAEVMLTDWGERQLLAWAEKLGGGWGVPHLADMMLRVAIVATTLLEEGVHYRVERNAVTWLLEDALLPGLSFYGKSFLARLVEIKEGCETGGQRELVARASYQQVFNRYVHLCGACHSLQLIESELRSLYGLKAGARWKPAQSPRYKQFQLFNTQQEKIGFVQTSLQQIPSERAVLLIANQEQALAELTSSLEGIRLQRVDTGNDKPLSECLQAGTVSVGLSAALEYEALRLLARPQMPLTIVYVDRSVRRSEDLKNRYWAGDSQLCDAEQVLVLSLEDEVFADVPRYGLHSVIRLLGVPLGTSLLERRLSSAQAARAQLEFKARQGLLSQESTMHSLLSFTGRELYE